MYVDISHNIISRNKSTLITCNCGLNKLCGRPPQYIPAPVTLTFDLLTLKVVSESRVTWATSVPILVSLPLCSRLRPDVRDRRTDRQTSDGRQTAPSPHAPLRGRGITTSHNLHDNTTSVPNFRQKVI